MVHGKTDVINLKGKSIHFYGSVYGLTSEISEVHRAFKNARPEVVALPIPEEELEGLKAISDGEDVKIELSRYEEIYARNLALFGEVRVPPPSLVEAFEICKEKSIPIVAIDMDDYDYTTTYINNITTMQLLRHSIRVKRLRKKKFRSSNPVDFAFEWDKTVNKLKGFKVLEMRREEYMAERLVELADEHSRILAVVELPRMEGILRKVKESLLDTENKN